MTTKLFQEVSASIRRVARQGGYSSALYDEGADAMRTYVLHVATIAISAPRKLWSGTTLQDVEREYILPTVRESGGVPAPMAPPNWA